MSFYMACPREAYLRTGGLCCPRKACAAHRRPISASGSETHIRKYPSSSRRLCILYLKPRSVFRILSTLWWPVMLLSTLVFPDSTWKSPVIRCHYQCCQSRGDQAAVLSFTQYYAGQWYEKGEHQGNGQHHGYSPEILRTSEKPVAC